VLHTVLEGRPAGAADRACTLPLRARSALLNAVAPDSVDERAVNLPPPAAAPARLPPGGEDPDAGAAAAPPERPAAAPDDGAPAGAAPAGAERDAVGAGGGGAGGGGAAPGARERGQALGRAEALQNCALHHPGSRGGGTLDRGGTLGRAEALQNCARALSAARAAGCGLADVAAADVADGAAPAARAVLWQLIRLGVVQVRAAGPRSTCWRR